MKEVRPMTLTLTPPPAIAKELDALPPDEQRARAEALMLRGFELEEAEAYSKTSSFAEFHDGMSLAERRDLDACLIQGLQEVEEGRGYTADEVLANVQKRYLGRTSRRIKCDMPHDAEAGCLCPH